MDTLLLFEILYLLSAIACAVTHPIYSVCKENKYWRGGSIKYYISYGHLVSGFLLGLVPIVNTICVGRYALYFFQEFMLSLDNKRVFKEKEKR